MKNRKICILYGIDPPPDGLECGDRACVRMRRGVAEEWTIRATGPRRHGEEHEKGGTARVVYHFFLGATLLLP